MTEKLFFTYAVQQPEVHHRTGSTSVLKQISLLLCSVPAAVGKYYNFLPSYHNLLIYRTTEEKKKLRRDDDTFPARRGTITLYQQEEVP